MTVRAIRMDASDNVALVTAEVKAGDAIELSDGTEVRAAETIPRGGKVAMAGSTSISVGKVKEP